MKNLYVRHIAGLLQLKEWQVENCVSLFEEGGTIPFISRYRKEKTGGMDDASVAEVRHWSDVFSEMEKRKETILGTIGAAGGLTDELRRRIEDCISSTELEDLYLPWRPKKKTRAGIAREAGLEPLADLMWNLKTSSPRVSAQKFLCDKVEDVDHALSGARDIIAERLAETVLIRENIRNVFRERRIATKVTKSGKESPDAAKYRSYFEFSYPLSRIPSHNILAILRASKEGFLKLNIDVDSEYCSERIFKIFTKQHGRPSGELADEIRAAAKDSFVRLLEPSISQEVIKEVKERADIESIGVFGENLRQLLLSPPVGQKRTMAIDPGFRNGCKIVCLNENGELLHKEIIFPHPPKNDKIRSIASIESMISRYSIRAVAIGNGTASRETMDFMKMVNLPQGCRVWMVSEDGASIYSASEVAREEFPEEDVTVRGAVSIGRRLMDPLAELVKIDPKCLGVGQYQHDVDQSLLKEKLDYIVEGCVNSVGVSLNTASKYLLSYVSGIGPALAAKIVDYRTKEGGFKSREDLKKVQRLGKKAFEQCAAFLRINDALNPLDNSAVHPECYHIVYKMADDLGVSTGNLVGNSELCSRIKAEDYVTQEVGIPTINDILKELAKPGRDPRAKASDFSFADDIRAIEDLKIGMVLPGIVTNITNFGAFVDIGLHENGLLHVSQIGPRGIVPAKVLKLHQHVMVSVVDIDLERGRISLGLPGR